MRKSAEGKAAGYAVYTGRTVTVMATHRVRPGKEEEVKAGEIETMEKLKESSGIVNPEIILVHGPKVLNNCLHLPNVRMADSMFSEQTLPEILKSSIKKSREGATGHETV